MTGEIRNVKALVRASKACAERAADIDCFRSAARITRNGRVDWAVVFSKPKGGVVDVLDVIWNDRYAELINSFIVTRLFAMELYWVINPGRFMPEIFGGESMKVVDALTRLGVYSFKNCRYLNGDDIEYLCEISSRVAARTGEIDMERSFIADNKSWAVVVSTNTDFPDGLTSYDLECSEGREIIDVVITDEGSLEELKFNLCQKLQYEYSSSIYFWMRVYPEFDNRYNKVGLRLFENEKHYHAYSHDWYYHYMEKQRNQ